MISERSIVRQSILKQNKMARWQRIICEAAEQSGRGRIPTLSQPVEYVAALEAAQTSHLAMIPWENELDKTITATLALNKHHEPQHIHNMALLIGPEGGFTESEIQDAQSVNIMPVTLGPRILRSETAAIVAATIIFHELGEMN
jgi:16S rRNA (uracil1498-N3)-methyltransferase